MGLSDISYDKIEVLIFRILRGDAVSSEHPIKRVYDVDVLITGAINFYFLVKLVSTVKLLVFFFFFHFVIDIL